MSETTPPTDLSDADPTKPAPKKKRKLWKWLLGGVLVLLLVVGLLVLLAPMIISTGAVRGMVVGKVNENLNGKVEIQNWNFTWTGGVTVEGVRVFDQSNAQIAEVKTISTELSLLDAAKGKIALGKTKIDGVNANLKQDEKGNFNFADLVKSDPAAPKTSKPAVPKPAGEPAKLPDVSGDIALTNISATIEQAGQPTLHVTNLNAGAVIKSLNDPIEHNFDVALKVQDKPAGKIALKGTASLKDQDINNLAVNDTLKLEGIDLEGLKALVPASTGVKLNKGKTDGEITLVVVDGKSATLNGKITGTDYEIAGDALKGDTFTTKQLNIALNQVEVAMPKGPTDTDSMSIKTGGDKGSAMLISWDQGSVSLFANTPLSALMNLAANKPAGADGKVTLAVGVDVAALSKVLPNTLSIPKEVDLKSGKLEELVDLTIKPDQATFDLKTNITDVAGTNEGRPVTLKPIHVSLIGKAIGTTQAMPDLRDLKLTLDSAFATAEFNAPTITQLTGKASADLAKLQAELGQIRDFQGKTLAGTFVMNVSTKGNPQKLSDAAPAKVDVTLENVVVTGMHEQPIKVEKFVAVIDSMLNATDAGALQSIDKTTITLKNKKGQEDTFDALINNIAVTLGETMTAKWNVDHLTADVGKLQDDLKPFVKQLQTSKLNVGKVTVKLEGDMTQAGATMTANVRKLSVNESGNLFAVSQPEGGVVTVKTGKSTMDAKAALTIKADLNRLQETAKPFVEALQKAGKLDVGTLDITLAADLAQTADALNANVTGLSITESTGLIALKKSDGGPLTVKMTTPKQGAGTMEAAGKLTIDADLKRGQAVAKAFQAQATVNGKSPEVVSGKLNGTVELATLDQKNLKLAGNFNVKDLSIDTGHGETARQEITLALASTAATDFSSVKDTLVDFKGPFGDVKLENAAVDLPAALPEGSKGTALPVVKSAKLTVDIKDMGPLDSLRSALAPAPAPPATQPVRVPRGAMKLAADVSQTGNDIVLKVTELSGTEELRLQQGDGIYKVKPFSNKDPLIVKVALSGNSQQPLEEQIKEINVSTLNLDLGVATIKSDKGLLITSPLGKEPVPSGNVVLAARIQNLTEIPEMLAKKKKGELYPYEGDLLLTQEFKKNGDNLDIKGNIGITNLVVLKDGQKVVEEKQVTIANEVLADMAKKNLTITRVLVDMPQSQALNVNVTGAINDWEKTRQFNNLVVTLAGDWAKLWTIVHPMMGKDANGKDPYEDLTVAGVFKDRKITVGGSMPAGVEGPAATRLLTATGSIGIDKVVWPSYGITEASNIEVPFTLKENLLTTAIADQPYTPMKVNGGTVNIHNFRYAIADPPRLFVDPNTVVIKDVSLTAALSDKMASLFGNPLFQAAKETGGTLTLTIQECNRFPVSAIATKKVPENDGRLLVLYSIENFRVVNEFATLLGQLIEKDRDSTGGDLQGAIKNATVTLVDKGIAQQDTTFLLGQRQVPIRFTGGVDLETMDLKNFLMNLPPTMLKQVTKDKNIVKYLPAGINVAMKGQAARPQFDFGNSIQTMIRDASQKALTDNLLGGGKKETPADPNAKPGDQKKNDDPIGGALDDLFNKKKKDDKKKK